MVARWGLWMQSLRDMIYWETHKHADTIPRNGTLGKLYGFPKEMYTGWEMETRFNDLGNKSQPSCSHVSNIYSLKYYKQRNQHFHSCRMSGTWFNVPLPSWECTFPMSPMKGGLSGHYLWKNIIDSASCGVYYLPTAKLKNLWKKYVEMKQRVCLNIFSLS